MTYQTLTEAPIKPKKQLNAEEILESLQSLGEDLVQITQLTSEEKLLVAQFFASMHKLLPLMTTPSLIVSASALSAEIGSVVQAQIDSAGRLSVTFGDGRQRLVDLSEVRHRDLLVAVIDDVLPKFKDLISQNVAEPLMEPSQIQESLQVEDLPIPQLPAPELLQTVDAPVSLGDVASVEMLVPLEVPKTPAAPALSDLTAKIRAIEAETLEYLDMLGNEVFEQTPVSKYFDDWMVNLRQIILSFESNEAIGQDPAFTDEYNQIFANIEDELAKRQATEADIEVSARRLVENRYLLNKIDEGYAAQSKELVVRGKSAIDYLTRNIQQIEAELAEVAQIKTSYRHPLQKMAKDQKLSELTQKLNAAKKWLALTLSTSSVDKAKSGDLDAEYAAQMQELAEKRKSALDILTQEVKSLEEELTQIEKAKTFNSLKKAQQRFNTTQILIAAKNRLGIAEQNSNAEQERLKAEYEKKKQAALGNVQILEKDIAAKAVDNSAGVRKQATVALVAAVKAVVQRKLATQ